MINNQHRIPWFLSQTPFTDNTVQNYERHTNIAFYVLVKDSQYLLHTLV